jgi:hypothetical protein
MYVGWDIGICWFGRNILFLAMGTRCMLAEMFEL